LERPPHFLVAVLLLCAIGMQAQGRMLAQLL
jgi:hypothetical protein